ncbi:hypothetical protein Back11_58870 [Paenibacillus baekrokdamisoli]|uniref:Uncharacterized protein n=1 Tax=Paenibacillus baekrokdamisoli TaxID=1712516 RepID=A0A3G9J1V7_9BACL|nr:DUF2569 domain-containing protein [Paenibacillus baekrokdamisoli]MBB3071425.1 putative membrane protein [Paenibacillus baekrokdamisoli]BBH24542.1 hypothetical protein Back11_58870 [Paenibacillus baekrokdamisoli]
MSLSDDLEKTPVKNIESIEIPKTNKPYLYGFGGWLILFSIGIAFQFLGNFKLLIDNYEFATSDDFLNLTQVSSENYNSLWKPTIWFEMLGQASLVALALLIAFFCIKKSPKFKTISITYIVFSLVFQVILLLVLSKIQQDYTSELFSEGELYTDLIKSIIYSIIWIPYFLVSRRVKNTFTPSPELEQS